MLTPQTETSVTVKKALQHVTYRELSTFVRLQNSVVVVWKFARVWIYVHKKHFSTYKQHVSMPYLATVLI